MEPKQTDEWIRQQILYRLPRYKSKAASIATLAHRLHEPEWRIEQLCIELREAGKLSCTNGDWHVRALPPPVFGELIGKAVERTPPPVDPRQLGMFGE